MNCDEFRSLFLAGEEDEATSRHLGGCRTCQSKLESLETDRTALGNLAVWEEPPPELEDRVVSLITGGSSRPAPRQERRVLQWIRPAAAAAALAVVVGIYAIVRPPAPDWEVAMPGTELSPQASSMVAGWNTDAGTRMVLTVEGLDAAPDGYMYEFWLSEGPVHISAGTFTGGDEIELWAGVARADFPRLWVTLEPVDDDESPSGHTVLDTGA